MKTSILSDTDLSLNNFKQSTPLYKILIFIGFLQSAIFALFLIATLYHEKLLINGMDGIEDKGELTFASLTEYHRIRKGDTMRFQYSYKVADSNGKLHEFIEIVDSSLNQKLRLGDTVPVYRHSIFILGNEVLISKIRGNQSPYSFPTLPLYYAVAGLGEAIFLTVLGGLIYLQKRPMDG